MGEETRNTPSYNSTDSNTTVKVYITGPKDGYQFFFLRIISYSDIHFHSKLTFENKNMRGRADRFTTVTLELQL